MKHQAASLLTQIVLRVSIPMEKLGWDRNHLKNNSYLSDFLFFSKLLHHPNQIFIISEFYHSFLKLGSKLCWESLLSRSVPDWCLQLSEPALGVRGDWSAGEQPIARQWPSSLVMHSPRGLLCQSCGRTPTLFWINVEPLGERLPSLWEVSEESIDMKATSFVSERGLASKSERNTRDKFREETS